MSVEFIETDESPVILLHYLHKAFPELMKEDSTTSQNEVVALIPNDEVIEIRIDSTGNKLVFTKGSESLTEKFALKQFAEFKAVYESYIVKKVKDIRTGTTRIEFETNANYCFFITCFFKIKDGQEWVEFCIKAGNKEESILLTASDDDAESIPHVLHNALKDVCGEYLSQEKVTEITCNEPEWLWIGYQGNHEMKRVSRPSLTYQILKSFATLVAESTAQKIGADTPLLSAQIPTGIAGKYYRIQLAIEPAVKKRHVAFSIRKPAMLNLTWHQYKEMFSRVKEHNFISEDERQLRALYESREYHLFLERAVAMKKTIIVSAATDSGKSTLVNSLTSLIPLDERLITIEDAAELNPPHENVLSLFYSKGGQGVSNVTVQSLLEACLRLRPNRILMGELRGEDAFTFLQMIFSGHQGAITTLHAEDPKGCLDRLAMMVLQHGTTLTTEQVKGLIHDTIDIIIQLKRTPEGGYGCESIYYKPCSDLLSDNTWQTKFEWQIGYVFKFIQSKFKEITSFLTQLGMKKS